MRHTVTPLQGGRPLEPHIWKPSHDPGRACACCGRPFESYTDQPDTAERKRLELQAIPFALPEKRNGP